MYLLLAAVLLVQDKSAEGTFTSLVRPIDEARTLTVKASVEYTSRGGENVSSHFSWTLLLRDENKVWLRTQSGDRETLYVSDGKKMAQVRGHMAGRLVEERETPWNLVPLLKNSLLRGGPKDVMSLLFLPKPGHRRREPGPVTDLKGPGGQEGRRTLEYTFVPATPWAELEGQVESAKATLTYDPGSGKPTKLYVQSKREGFKGTCPPIYPDVELWTTVTFDEFTLNADIPDEKFKLPEEKK
jgi:hypothetical protein